MHVRYGPGTVRAPLTECQCIVETEDLPDGTGETGCADHGNGWGTTSDREAHPAMSRLLAAVLTVAAAAALAVGAALGIVALLDATPDQPNTP